jgi:hypothetical protein
MGCGRRCSYYLFLFFLFGFLVLCWGGSHLPFAVGKSSNIHKVDPTPHLRSTTKPPSQACSVQVTKSKKHHTWRLASQPASQPATYRHPKKKKKKTIVCNLLLRFLSWNDFFFKKKYFRGWLSLLLSMDDDERDDVKWAQKCAWGRTDGQIFIKLHYDFQFRLFTKYCES